MASPSLLRERACQQCGTRPITGYKFCSPACRAIAQAEARTPWTLVANRERGCVECSTAYQAITPHQLYCSRVCQKRASDRERNKGRGAYRQAYYAKHRSPPKRERRWPSSKVYFAECAVCDQSFTSKRPLRFCPAHATSDLRRRAKQAQRPPISGTCAECDLAFVRPDLGALQRTFCSTNCSTKHAKRINRVARKATERSARVEAVNPFVVFNRDGWRCKMCDRPTPKRLRGTYQPRAPELDHIIPLSKGGEHSYRNTQCSCRECNLAKGDSERGQLLLFG